MFAPRIPTVIINMHLAVNALSAVGTIRYESD